MQHHGLTTRTASDVSREKVLERIVRTATIVKKNISKIFENQQQPMGSPLANRSNAPIHMTQCNSSSFGGCTAATFSQNNNDSVILPCPVLGATTSSNRPNLHLPDSEIPLPYERHTKDIAQHFVTTLNDFWSKSTVGQDEDNDDEIICLDTSISQEQAWDPADDNTPPFTPSSSFSGADSFIPVSPCPTQLTLGLMGDPNSLNIWQQKNGVSVWNDQIVVKLMNLFAEWSIEHPNKRKAYQLLVNAIQRRTVEIGVQDEINPKALSNRIHRIRQKMRHAKQQDEAVAAQRRLHESNMTIPQNAIIQIQQHPNFGQPNFYESGNLSENKDDEEIEVLDFYGPGRVDNNNFGQSNNGNVEQTNNDSNVDENNNDSNVDENNNDRIVEQDENDRTVEQEDNDRTVEHDNDSTGAAGRGRVEESNVLDVVDNVFKQLRGEIEERIEVATEVSANDMVKQVVTGTSTTLHWAKRSRPFNRTIVENVGWRKKFVRIPWKPRDTSGLIKFIEGRADCNQDLLDALKHTNPSLFLNIDKFVPKCMGENSAMNGDKKFKMELGPINEFDGVFKEWMSKMGQNDNEKNGEEVISEETQEEEEEERVCRGPVIKCPRMPKIRVRVKRVNARTSQQ